MNAYYRYRHTHVSAYYYCKGYWCWHFQRKTLLLYFCFIFGFTFCLGFVPENYRRNLLAIQSSLDSTNKRQCSHIHDEFLREGCAAALYYTLPFLFFLSDTCDLSYMSYAHMYLCVYVVLSFTPSLASGRDLSTSMLPFLGIMDFVYLLHCMLACSNVARTNTRDDLKMFTNYSYNSKLFRGNRIISRD